MDPSRKQLRIFRSGQFDSDEDDAPSIQDSQVTVVQAQRPVRCLVSPFACKLITRPSEPAPSFAGLHVTVLQPR